MRHMRTKPLRTLKIKIFVAQEICKSADSLISHLYIKTVVIGHGAELNKPGLAFFQCLM